jgi:hypothetical protein
MVNDALQYILAMLYHESSNNGTTMQKSSKSEKKWTESFS